VAVNPLGKFAYVTDYYNGVFGHDVLMYAIDASAGALTLIGTIAAGTGPGSVALDPTGKFAYVTNFDSNNVSMYSIDPATGALTLIGTVGI
jgi:DNA-binding beta-propeller fold protein YncE